MNEIDEHGRQTQTRKNFRNPRTGGEKQSKAARNTKEKNSKKL